MSSALSLHLSAPLCKNSSVQENNNNKNTTHHSHASILPNTQNTPQQKPNMFQIFKNLFTKCKFWAKTSLHTENLLPEPLNLLKPSLTMKEATYEPPHLPSCSGIACTVSFICTDSSAPHNRSSGHLLSGSKLNLVNRKSKCFVK